MIMVSPAGPAGCRYWACGGCLCEVAAAARPGNECSTQVCHPDPSAVSATRSQKRPGAAPRLPARRSKNTRNVVKPEVRYQLLAARAGGFGRTPILPPACWQPEGIFIRSPQDLHSNSTCLAPTAVRRCLRIRTPVPGMAGQSAWMRLGGQPPSKWRTRVPGDPSRAARLIPRIPGAVRLWPKWARASWDTLLGLHDAGGTNEQPSQLRSHPGRTRCDPAR